MLAPADLALLAAQGIVKPRSSERSGSGWSPPARSSSSQAAPLRHGQIFNSNRVMLSAMLSAWPWVEIIDFGIVPDAEDLLSRDLPRRRANATC